MGYGGAASELHTPVIGGGLLGPVGIAGAAGGDPGFSFVTPVSSQGTVRVTLVGFLPQTVQTVTVSVNPGGT